MRYTIVVLALVALGAAIPQPKQRAADQSLLNKQQECIDLLLQITGDIPNEQLNNLGQNYDIQANAQHYDNPTIVKYYANIVQQGLVQPKGTPYSSSISQLRKEVSLLYYILLGAQDYQTFVKTAAWARIHVNEVQFLKAFSAAILQRQDTQGIILPAMYEILPQYFFDARIIQEVQNIEAKCIQAKGIQNPNGQNDVIIPVNYTAYLPNGEHELSYFTQDVGIQSYYKDINLAAYILEQQSEQEQQQQQQQQQQSSGENQQSLNGDGSRWLYLHQQLLARYQLNRLGSGLGPIQDVNYENIGTPFQPHLRHLNGLELPGRFENVQPNTEQKKQLIKSVKILELRLIDAIDSGFVKTTQGDVLSLYQPQGLNILGEIIKGTGKSINPRYYGSLQAALSQLLGNAPEVENIWDYSPSVLELQTTAVRDPAFYQLWKKVLSLLKQYQESLPAYQYNNLLLQGVTIDNVHVSPLVTYFDNFYVNLGETTPHPSGQQGHIKAQLKRLDHKPYEYQIKVNSQNPIQNAVVRVFLGPKYNSEGKPISISQQRQEFVELDQFIVNLQPGQNIIDRKSHQAPGQSYDYPSIDEIQQSVNNAIRSQEPLYITPPQQILGFPARLSLPKGTPNGLPLQMLVMISGPGQISPSNGPVIPEKSQTYQQQQYQVVTPEQYQQIQVQQSLGQSGVQKTVEVLPQQNIVGQQNIQVAQSHYGNLYTKTRGQMHAQWQVGQGHQGYDQYPQQQIQNQQQGHQHQQQQGQQGQYQYGQLMQQQPQYQYGQHVQQLPQFGGQQQQQQQSQQQQPQQQQQGHLQQWQQVQHPQQWQEQQQYKAQQQAEIQGGVRGLISGIQAGLKGGVQLPVGQVQGNLQAGVHGLQGGVSVGLQSGADSGVQYGTHVQGYQQVPWSQGMSSGQIHAGGYQGIQKGQGQQGQQQQQQQDSAVNQLLQNKHITEIIGGAISLDGKPFGYPLDRPLALGALQVPNIYVQNVHIVHEGEPTNEISQ